jgi:hypothetical protein
LHVKLGLPALVIPLALGGAALGFMVSRLRWPRWTAWPLGVVASGLAAFGQVAVWSVGFHGPWFLAALALLGPLVGWFRRPAVV